MEIRRCVGRGLSFPRPHLSFPRKRESILHKYFWIPAFARTTLWTRERKTLRRRRRAIGLVKRSNILADIWAVGCHSCPLRENDGFLASKLRKISKFHKGLYPS